MGGIYDPVNHPPNRKMYPHLFDFIIKLSFSWITTLKDYLRGFFLYAYINQAYEEKRQVDDLLKFLLFGRTIGIPYLFNYYHLHLLPYYVKGLGPWKRRVLRERDFFDIIGD
jgi:hypothetical protein